MKNCVETLSIKPDIVLVDAVKLDIDIETEAIIKGDLKSYTIGCASILAKVYRDRLMLEYSKIYSGYGFERNSGYGTKEHLQAITQADERYGRIYDKYAAAGVLDETLFMVVSDHGGTPEKTHGGTSDAEKIITFAAAGRHINSGCSFEKAEIRDLAPITAFALGAPIPETWTAKIPQGLFV